MRNALVVAIALVAGVACGTKQPEQPAACTQLYALLDRLETCTTVGNEQIGAKRKAIDELIAAAKKQGDYEGLCRNEAWVLRKVYERTAPECLK